MTNRKGPPQAGGFIIAAAILLGVVAGIVAGEPSIGFLAGIGVGIVLALMLWWKDRPR